MERKVSKWRAEGANSMSHGSCVWAVPALHLDLSGRRFALRVAMPGMRGKICVQFVSSGAGTGEGDCARAQIPEQPKYVVPADWTFDKLRKLAATRLRETAEPVQGVAWKEAPERRVRWGQRAALHHRASPPSAR